MDVSSTSDDAAGEESTKQRRREAIYFLNVRMVTQPEKLINGSLSMRADVPRLFTTTDSVRPRLATGRHLILIVPGFKD